MGFAGYMGCYLLVDLENAKIEKFDFKEDIKRKFLGGYGIGCKYIYENQKANTDPFSPENIIAFMSGPLNGTTIPGSARYVVCAKSPLTNSWGDANCGGSFGPSLKMAGYDGVFIKGISEKPVYLLLENGKATLKNAEDLWGKDTYECDDLIRKKYGKNAESVIIGKAGELKSLIACIVNRKGKVAGRSGMGAIMGSKKLKAIVAFGNKKVEIFDKDLYELSRKNFIKDIMSDYGDASWLRHGGTPTSIEFSLDVQDSPIKNWAGVTKDMGDYSEFKYENIEKYLTKRETCYKCPIGCWDRLIINKGNYSLSEPSSVPEYETAAMFGSNCLNNNFESIVKCNDICNRNGIDTISAGGTIAFAIECFENGIITKEDTDGLELTWGNHEAIVKTMEKIAEGKGFGEVLINGSKKASEIIGKGSEKFAMHISGRELPAHDPRWDPSLAVIYALEPTPANHCQGAQNLGHKDLENVFPDVDFSTCAGENKTKFSGRAKEIIVLMNLIHTVNCTGMCWFAWGCTEIKNHIGCLKAVTGWDIQIDELYKTGERIMNMRQLFNLREGINQFDRKIPGRILGRPPLHDGLTKDIVIDWDTMLKEFYDELDWDLEKSIPSKKKMKELDLDWVIKDDNS